jgi:hypothetical protein
MLLLRIRFWDGNKQAQELKKVMSGSAIQERQDKTKRKEPREEKHGELTMIHKTKLSERERCEEEGDGSNNDRE